MALTRSDDVRLEARKAEGATITALRMPRPPNFTEMVCSISITMDPYLTDAQIMLLFSQ